MTTARFSFLRPLTSILALAAPALLAVACNLGEVPIGTDGQKVSCDDSSDCAGGESCQNDVCETCTPSTEACDGLDNDCNGAVDDDAVCLGGGTCLNGMCCQNGACGPDPVDPCMTDMDCAPGQVCSNGTCTVDPVDPVCTTDMDCAAGQACINGLCTFDPVDPCMTDMDCAAGQVCVSGTCHSDMCSPAAEACDGIDNDCDGLIDDNAFCPNGGTCLNGMCTPDVPCATAMDCAAGQACINGVCSFDPVDPCMTDMDCAAGQACINGVCDSGMCSPSPEACDGLDNDCDGLVDDNAFCANGGTCQMGNCHPDVPCMTPLDCAPGQACVNGLCSFDPMDPVCMTDMDCAPGLLCQNGACQLGMCSPAPELCDGIDNDCDGLVDDNAFCPNGGSCQAGMCCQGGACPGTPCMSNMDCAPGKLCQNGLCQP